MTLPFRRRHHDDETAHDRARALTAREMLEPLSDDATGWLTGHLDSCAECRRDREAYLADRELVRALRDRAPEPPRDLWARTSTALDREAGMRGRQAAAPSRRWQGWPYGAAAGALLVAVVIGVSNVPPIPPSTTPGGSSVAIVTTDPQPTPFNIDAGRVAWVQAAADGSWALIVSEVDAVCPRTRPACQALGGDDPGTPVNLGSAPTGVTFNPDLNQLVVESRGQGTAPDRIFVVAVPAPEPSATPTHPGTPTEAPPVTAVPTSPATPEVTVEPTTASSQPPPSPEPSPTTPDGALEIASGVVVVGETAYSDDGAWLAFSARPSDGSTGPDLYLWKVGDPVATPVTTDHQTYFSAWLGGQVLASRIEIVPTPAPGGDPLATTIPDPTGPASGAPSGAPSDAPSAPPQGTEGRPASFLLDPSTLVRTPITQPDVWLPVADPTGRFVVYWSGTLASTADGLGWQLGTGRLVLDGWSGGHMPGPSAEPSIEPSAEPAPGTPAVTEDPAVTGDPMASAAPTPGFGPAGSPVPVVDETTAAFKAKFDPTGTRLAVWVGEQFDATVGRLHLFVLDPETGAIQGGLAPLPGAPALRKFTIDVGRLAWVSPRGQDGQESSVQVLGWLRNEFGEIRTIPARDLLIVH